LYDFSAGGVLDNADGFADAFEIGGFGGTAEEGDGGAEGFGAEVARRLLERSTVEVDAAFGFFDEGGLEQFRGERGEDFMGFAGEEGGAADGLDGGGGEDFQGGEEDGADAVSQIEIGVVGFVFAPGLVDLGEVFSQGGAAEGEEGAEEGEPPPLPRHRAGGFHGGEAVDAGAAHEAEEDGFGLVIRMVSHDDGGAVMGLGDGVEGFEASGAGGGFAGGFFEAELFDGAGEGEGFGEGADEGGVGTGGFAANAVIDVGDMEDPLPMVGLVDGVEEAQEGDGVSAAADGEEKFCVARQEGGAMQFVVEGLDQSARGRHNGSMKSLAYRNRRAGGLHGFGVGLCLSLGVLAGRLAADDDVSDLLLSAKSTTTAPAEVTGPATQPGAGMTDALGTMKTKVPAGAREGTVTLSNGVMLKGEIWTTLETPFRVWVEARKTYEDVDLSLVMGVEVKVAAQSMEDDWRWLKEGSDQKVYSGKKYPLVELGYVFTLVNGQTVEGGVVAPVYVVEENGKRHSLALYKKYKGKLDETMGDVAYIKSIELKAEEAGRNGRVAASGKLPLIY
jgi:hypothetical protein